MIWSREQPYITSVLLLQSRKTVLFMIKMASLALSKSVRNFALLS